MKEKDLIIWNEFRKIGEFKYTLLMSLFFIIFTNILQISGHHFTFNIKYILVNIILCSSVGVLFGKLTWIRSEIMYENKKNQL